MWRRLSFRAKLVSVGLAVQIAAMLLTGWHSAYLIDRYFRAELVARAQRQAPLLNAALAAPMVQRDYATLQAILNESLSKDVASYIIVCDTKGRAVGQAGWPENSAKPDATLPQPITLADGSTRFDFKAPLRLENQVLGVLHFGLSGSSIADARNQMLLAMGLMGLAVLVLFSILLVALSIVLTKPLRQLAAASRQMHAGNFDVTLKAGSGDEFGTLTEDFRHMAHEVKQKIANLTASEALQRQTLADLQQEHVALELARTAAETANRAKSDFLAKMSHEIRTPMHGILGTVDLMNDGSLTAQQQQRIEVIQRSGSALLDVLNNVLDFSRIQAGKFELDAVEFNPGDLALDTASLFAAIAATKGMGVTAEVHREVPKRIRGDATRLRQVLVNLVGNAVKFSERGSVRIRMRPHAERELLVEVEDDGIGIAQEAIARIFEPFSQADNSTTRRFGGTGLGLAISGQIIKLMGGELNVESTPGRGSTFRVIVPFQPATLSETVAVAASDIGVPRRFNALVLLAEDNQVNQFLAKAMLAKLGCRIEIAANGVEAIAMFKATPFDLILMDCQMPEMNGYTAATAIRALESTTNLPPTPIVALTANVEDGERERCLAAGMNDYLAKPFSLAGIAMMIEKWLPLKPSADQEKHRSTV